MPYEFMDFNLDMASRISYLVSRLVFRLLRLDK